MDYAIIRFIVAQYGGAEDKNRIGVCPTLKAKVGRTYYFSSKRETAQLARFALSFFSFEDVFSCRGKGFIYVGGYHINCTENLNLIVNKDHTK